MATVRYLAVVIPICIYTSVLSIQALTGRAKWLAVPLAVLAFGTNALHGGPLVGVDNKAMFSKIIAHGRIRSTVVEFTRELMDPPPSAYRATADWINVNLKENETVWVMPDFATYPLMFHAPRALYAWQIRPHFADWYAFYRAPEDMFEEQLKKRKEGQFKGLPEIHFYGQIPPDYVIAFGPHAVLADTSMKRLRKRGVHYAMAKQIGLYWYDLIRPELFWHSFREIKDFSRASEAIYIFKRLD
jgi:hypothetical protein